MAAMLAPSERCCHSSEATCVSVGRRQGRAGFCLQCFWGKLIKTLQLMGKNTPEVSGFTLGAWQSGCRWEAEPQTYPGCLLVEAGVQNLECKTWYPKPSVQNLVCKTQLAKLVCKTQHA